MPRKSTDHNDYFPGQKQFPSINPSIRHQLEMDAWRRHPAMASRLARRLQREVPARRKLRWQDRTLLVVGITLVSLLLIRIETAQADEWGMQFGTDDRNGVQLALDTDIRAEVTGLVARVEVTQLFSNPTGQWVEGIYRFPLPGGAAVDRMHIEVGERSIVGEIREREAARRVYQQASAEGMTASLVEQHKPNQFETRLANIGPGEEIQVTIGFLVNVDMDQGVFSLRLPMTFTPRGGPPSVTGNAPMPALTGPHRSANHALELEVLIHSGIGLASIESRYHDVDIEPVAHGYRVTMAGADERTDRDFELAWFPDLQAVPQSALMTWDSGEAVYAQLMMIPPMPGAVVAQPREAIFIIDTSGSMDGLSIQQARAALKTGLAGLNPDDAFNLVQFNSGTEVLFPASVGASPGNIEAAEAWIDALVAEGGTVMAPALHAAFTMSPEPGLLRQVVFVTDGSINNEQQLLGLIGEQLGDSRLFTVSIGSAPNSWFMRKAAEIGRGSHTHIGKLDEVEARMEQLWSKIRLPAMSDICIDWGTSAEYYPEVIPDLYAGEPLWVVARLPLQPGKITICGQLNGTSFSQESTPWHAPGNDTLALMWARRKIESLEDGMLFGDDREAANAEILEVALDYGLLTSQTSMVAVDKTPARPADEALESGNIPGLLPSGSAQGVGFANTATGWRAQVILSFLTLFVASWMFRASIHAGKRSKASTGPRLPLLTTTRTSSDAAT